MKQSNLTLNSNGACLIDGELTFSTVSILLGDSKTLWKDHSEINIDFSKVTHADSAALALLLEWMRFAKKNKKNISFYNLPEQLLNLIKISGLEKMINIKEEG